MNNVEFDDRLTRDIVDRLARAILNGLAPSLTDVRQRLERLEDCFAMSVVKESYTTEEAAERLGRSDWTVRQWCNKGQVKGAKKVRGKGRTGEWRIPHDELVRLQNEGPLPIHGGQAA
jgi:excisionase family DNA binding protein